MPRQDDDQKIFDDRIRMFNAEIANAGFYLHWDARARSEYSRMIAEFSKEVAEEVKSGKITWSGAAKKAQEIRNAVMETLRDKSSPVGRAYAEHEKPKGRTLNALIAEKVEKIHGKSTRFDQLSTRERNVIYKEIVESSGRSRPRITAVMRRLGPAGRGLLILSVAVSVYNIATAENKVQATAREVTVVGAGIGGGVAGGAAAGLLCGPGAPVCVTIGAFVGGALAAFGVSLFW